MRTDLENAVTKARKVNCEVKAMQGRRYAVRTPERHHYTVRFWMEDGKRFGVCSCKAGQTFTPCYHLVHAATADSWATGYPTPDHMLLITYALNLKGSDVWTDEQWDDLRMRALHPEYYWQRLCASEVAA